MTAWLFADGGRIGGFGDTKLPHCACCMLQNAHTLVPATTRLPKKKQSYCPQSPKKKSLLFLDPASVPALNHLTPALVLFTFMVTGLQKCIGTKSVPDLENDSEEER